MAGVDFFSEDEKQISELFCSSAPVQLLDNIFSLSSLAKILCLLQGTNNNAES